jgi:putative PIN family toxin of toxin-antitoxin system
MRVVLDTNVLVAAFIAHGVCNDLLEHCFLSHEVVLSKAILDELQDVLARKLDFTKDETRAVTRLLRGRGLLTKPAMLPAPVCRDPDDDTILATALAGDCILIVTGDKDLIDIGEYSGIKILRPSEFWEFENRHAENFPRTDD